MANKTIQKVFDERRELDQAARLKDDHEQQVRAKSAAIQRANRERLEDHLAQTAGEAGAPRGHLVEWTGLIGAAVAALVILISLVAMR